MIKTVFFDVDGTLFSHRNNLVPESTQMALQLLKNKGIKTVLATGRHIEELRSLPVSKLSFDAYILLNGQLCTDSAGNAFYKKPIKDTEIIVRMFREKKIPVVLADEEHFYVNFVNDVLLRVQEEIHTPVPPVGEYKNGEIYLAVMVLNREEEHRIIDGIPGIAVTRWNEHAIDIVAAGGSKVDGIRAYLDMNGFCREEAAAFGDGENDIGMLRYVGHGVAMGNADAETKAAADVVTADIDDDGILRGLQMLDIL